VLREFGVKVHIIGEKRKQPDGQGKFRKVSRPVLDVIRAMDEAKFSAERTKEKLEDLEKAVITVSYTDLKNVANPAREFLTDRGTITEDSRNKKLIVKDIPKVIVEIQELVAELDTPEKQVLIESRIVEVTNTYNFDFGINWLVDYSQDASFAAPHTTSNQESSFGFGGDFVVSPLGPGAGIQPGLGSTLSWGRVGVDTTILDLRISAAETAGDARVVSNPRILTLNGEKAKISQGTLIPYVSSDGDSVKTEFVEAALKLEVTPVINPDNTVILDVLATNSAPQQFGALVGIDNKEAKSKMLVKDGETMVIGGVFVETDEEDERGVPVLMKIPLLGHLFKSSTVRRTRAELMVFITPRIIE
jgi:type IV pilus assembly protein PilQ